MSEQKAYYKEWYEKNREQVAERRRGRYSSDPEYRERVLSRGRDSRQRKRQDRPDPRPKQPTEVWHHGAKFVSIHELARKLGKYILTVRLWFRKGLMPQSPYVSVHGPQKRQWFSGAMVDAMCEHVGKAEGKHMSSKELAEIGDKVRRAWVEMGVPVGETVVIRQK
jgi:hypothetical protein